MQTSFHNMQTIVPFNAMQGTSSAAHALEVIQQPVPAVTLTCAGHAALAVGFS